MSRRSARYSLDERENDALLEFENFKKKFLLANKHITKLNSTLSVRIEELSAQVAELQAENLRLRESEMAVSRQLKSEREKSRHLMLNAENAVHALIKHFGAMRSKFDVPLSASPPDSPKRTSPNAKNRLSRTPVENMGKTGASPPRDRLAKMPEEPAIAEDDEPTEDSPRQFTLNTVSAFHYTNAPATTFMHPRGTSPPSVCNPKSTPPSTLPQAPLALDLTALAGQVKKKPSRRQSGIFTTFPTNISSSEHPSHPTPSSPLAESSDILGSCIRMQPDHEETLEHKSSRRPLGKALDRRKSAPSDGFGDSDSPDGGGRGRKIIRGPSRKLKDVTNSPHRNLPPPSLGDENTQPSATMPAIPPVPDPLVSLLNPPPPPLPIPVPTKKGDIDSSEIILLSPSPQSDTPIPASRTTRARRSVNYAEPKLNTKMRKPEPTPEELARIEKKRKLKRASAAASLPSSQPTQEGSPSSFPNEIDYQGPRLLKTQSSLPVENLMPSFLLPPSPPRTKASKPTKAHHPYYGQEEGNAGDDGVDADEEYVASSKERRRKSLSGVGRREKAGEEVRNW